MHDSIHPPRLTRPRRAHLLAVALLLSVVLVAGCTGSSGSPATTAPASPAPSSAVVTDCLLPPASCYTPYLFRVAYGIQPLLDSGIDGRGETVTVLDSVPTHSFLEAAPPGQPPAATDIRQDLKTFDSLFRLPAARIQVVTTLAGSASPWQASGQEVGDLEIVHAVAPAATLRVVLMPSIVLASAATATKDMIAGLRLAVSGTGVASISWGLGEHYFTPAQVAQMHSILLGADVHHVTVIASSGEYGGFGDTPGEGTPAGGTPVKEVDLPASDPLVLAVGGTTLTLNPATGAYTGETAWNGEDCSGPTLVGASVAASATCTPVPPIRMASPGSRRCGACPTWPVTLISRAVSRWSSPTAAGDGSSRSPAPAPPRSCGGDSWRWPARTPITTSASSTPPSTASPAAPATTRPSMTSRPVTAM